MKRKIAYLITTAALITSAFFIGKSAQLNHSIPTEDIACYYTNADGYITVELKDVTRQLDNKANAKIILIFQINVQYADHLQRLLKTMIQKFFIVLTKVVTVNYLANSVTQ